MRRLRRTQQGDHVLSEEHVQSTHLKTSARVAQEALHLLIVGLAIAGLISLSDLRCRKFEKLIVEGGRGLEQNDNAHARSPAVAIAVKCSAHVVAKHFHKSRLLLS